MDRHAEGSPTRVMSGRKNTSPVRMVREPQVILQAVPWGSRKQSPKFTKRQYSPAKQVTSGAQPMRPRTILDGAGGRKDQHPDARMYMIKDHTRSASITGVQKASNLSAHSSNKYVRA